MMKTARMGPPILPDPPEVLTPPRTTIAITESSYPKATLGLVEPMREQRKSEVKPAISPVKALTTRITESVLMPEYRAAVRLLPIAKTLRPKLVLCRSSPNATAQPAKTKRMKGTWAIVPQLRKENHFGKWPAAWS